MSELLPCPFCGSNNVAQGSSRGLISVWCFCGAQGPNVDFPDDCIEPIKPILECHEAWNRRCPSAEQSEAWQEIGDDTPKDVPVLLGWKDVHSDGWQYEADLYGSTRGGWLHGQATHWMPLPSPPPPTQPEEV